MRGQYVVPSLVLIDPNVWLYPLETACSLFNFDLVVMIMDVIIKIICMLMNSFQLWSNNSNLIQTPLTASSSSLAQRGCWYSRPLVIALWHCGISKGAILEYLGR